MTLAITNRLTDINRLCQRELLAVNKLGKIIRGDYGDYIIESL